MRKALKITYQVFAAICVTGVVYFGLTTAVLYMKPNLKNLPYTEEEKATLAQMSQQMFDEYRTLPEIGLQEWKQKVNKAAKARFYIERFAELPTAGLAMPQIRLVLMDTNYKYDTEPYYSGYNYGSTLMHEICHVKYYSVCERKVVFSAFKLMWESADAYSELTAIQNAIGYANDSNYNADGLIIDYLKKRGEFPNEQNKD